MTHAHDKPSRRSLTVGLLAASVLAHRKANAAEPVRIAAASDLQVVLPEIAAAFEGRSGTSARITYGSTGNLARQIRQGAPFEVFLAADERFVLELVQDGVVTAAGPIYARGRLALAARRGEAFHQALLAADPLDDIATMLRAGTGFRIAIANPEHAPYGQRAVEVLRARNLFELFRPRLVYGENVAQATQYVATGSAALGIVSHSTARAPAMATKLVTAAVPQALHSPLDQRLALTPRASPAAAAFAEFLLSTNAQSLFSSHDFDPPPTAVAR